jgi:hypothetical protein
VNQVPIAPHEIRPGMDVTAHWKHPRGSAQGGKVIGVDEFVHLVAGTAEIHLAISLDEVDHWTTEVPFDADECSPLEEP